MILLDICLVSAGAVLLHKVFVNFQAAAGELALGGERVAQWYRRGILAMATAIVCLSVVGQHVMDRVAQPGMPWAMGGEVSSVCAKTKIPMRRFSWQREKSAKHGKRRTHRSHRSHRHR